MEDICEGPDCEFHNSIMSRVTKRYQARFAVTFTYACRGYGKTTGTVSTACNSGILWPGEVTGYYAPVEKQAAPLASKAFASYERNYPLLAAHWKRLSDSKDSFRIGTRYGSRFIMDIDRGMDTSCVIAEECAQEDKNPFNWAEFRQVVLGTNRRQYSVGGFPDPRHIDFREHYITSATGRENEAYLTCRGIRDEMRRGESAFALWIPWQVVVMCGMKPKSYYEKLRKRLTAEQFMRECESICTGSAENPLVRQEVLDNARSLKCMEDCHCGTDGVFYILGYDVSSRDASGNAMTAVAVLKCSPGGDGAYRKELVYVCDRRPPATAREHARSVKRFWAEYRVPGAMAPYLVVDARSYGKSVVECLHEDMGDGLPPLATITHEAPYGSLELKGAVPCLYPLQATGAGGRDPNADMLDYAVRELESGNLTLLTGDLAEGLACCKLRRGIRTDRDDALLQIPYVKTTGLIAQISNLRKKYGPAGWTETAINSSVPKDMWSALVYALRMAQRLENENMYACRRASGQWEAEAEWETEDTAGYRSAPRRQGRMRIPGRGENNALSADRYHTR